GHARSRDLVHWEHLPLALFPQHPAGEIHCCSGCLALSADGQVFILYSSGNGEALGPIRQVHATPDDPAWRSWTQHIATPFLDLTTHDGPAFEGSWRDPFVFRDGGRTFLILGAILGDDAVIPLYENPFGDLRRWHYRGIIHRAPRTETIFFECPSLVRFGPKWLLLTSPVREVDWCSGTLDLDRAQFHVERRGRVDESDHYYATYPATDPSGRVVMFAWAQKFPKGRGWNGCLGVPRRIWLDDDGLLCSEPVAEIGVLRAATATWPAQPLTNRPTVLALPGDSCDGELELELSSGATVRFAVGGVNVTLSAGGVQFGTGPVGLAGPARPQAKVRWLLDRSLLEIFFNDRAAYTRVVPYPPPATASISVTGGAARLAAGRVSALRLAGA
ncbi:MAG: glycoside hydrolase family 32 protein, partial [Opitutales bacterium]